MRREVDLARGQFWVCPTGHWRLIDATATADLRPRVLFSSARVAWPGASYSHRAFWQWITRNKATLGRVVPAEDGQ